MQSQMIKRAPQFAARIFASTVDDSSVADDALMQWPTPPPSRASVVPKVTLILNPSLCELPRRTARRLPMTPTSGSTKRSISAFGGDFAPIFTLPAGGTSTTPGTHRKRPLHPLGESLPQVIAALWWAQEADAMHRRIMEKPGVFIRHPTLRRQYTWR